MGSVDSESRLFRAMVTFAAGYVLVLVTLFVMLGIEGWDNRLYELSQLSFESTSSTVLLRLLQLGLGISLVSQLWYFAFPRVRRQYKEREPTRYFQKSYKEDRQGVLATVILAIIWIVGVIPILIMVSDFSIGGFASGFLNSIISLVYIEPQSTFLLSAGLLLLGSSYLTVLFNEHHLRLKKEIVGDNKDVEEVTDMIREERLRVRSSFKYVGLAVVLLIIFGFILLSGSLNNCPFMADAFVQCEPYNPAWDEPAVAIVLGGLVSSQLWYLVCKPVYPSYKKEKEETPEARIALYAPFAIGILVILALYMSVTFRWGIKRAIIPHAVALSIIWARIGNIMYSVKDTETPLIETDFNEDEKEVTVRIQNPGEANQIDVLINEKVEYTFQSPSEGDMVTLDKSEEASLSVKTRRSGYGF